MLHDELGILLDVRHIARVHIIDLFCVSVGPPLRMSKTKVPQHPPNPTRFKAVFGLVGQPSRTATRKLFTRRYGASAYISTGTNRVWVPLYSDFQVLDGKEEALARKC